MLIAPIVSPFTLPESFSQESKISSTSDHVEEAPKELKNRQFATVMKQEEPISALNILEVLNYEDTVAFGDQEYKRRQHIYGKKVVIKAARSSGEKKREILQILEDLYVNYLL